MEFVTHKRDDGEYQPLKDHMTNVAARASVFAAGFDAAAHAERTGLLHDVGKYSPAAQRRQREPERVGKVDHGRGFNNICCFLF